MKKPDPKQATLFELAALPALVRMTGKKKRRAIYDFKLAHGIKTQRTPYPIDLPWIAVKVPEKRLDDGGPIEGLDVGDMIAAFGRLLEEGGLTGIGKSELAAIRDLCRNLNLSCAL